MNRALAYLALILTILFYWIIYPYKWIKKAVFNYRKNDAIKKAVKLHLTTNRHQYVVQNGTRFLYGDRRYFRNKQIKWNKRLRKIGIETDYKQAIIFTADGSDEMKKYMKR